MARRLWDEWLPLPVRRLIAGVLPGGEVDARRLVVWLGGVRDIGKASPSFACQGEQLAQVVRGHGLESVVAGAAGPPSRRPRTRCTTGPHHQAQDGPLAKVPLGAFNTTG
ncbi:HD domain-containing protein [Streptomyces sp. NPDC086782]|uniref:HD domain-containing protein n=1 Tax=Streptomyces sp. NPDC086782 TaxID=3365757 RepID=UPI0037F607E5